MLEVTAQDVRSLLTYDPETGVFTWNKARGPRRAGAIAGCDNGSGYIVIRVNWRLAHAHRLAWLYMTGEWPQALIDHKDNNPSNNAWSNLREATKSQNGANSKRSRRNKSGFKGVWEDKKAAEKRWVAEITHNSKKTTLGYFSTPEEAHTAYLNAAKAKHGEYGRAA